MRSFPFRDYTKLNHFERRNLEFTKFVLFCTVLTNYIKTLTMYVSYVYVKENYTLL